MDAPEGPAHPAVSPSSLTVGRIGKEAIQRATGSGSRSWWRGLFGASVKPESQEEKRIMFLVCGPDPWVANVLSTQTWQLTLESFCSMVAAIAGPFGRNFSQGEIGGILGKLGYDGKTVWKL